MKNFLTILSIVVLTISCSQGDQMNIVGTADVVALIDSSPTKNATSDAARRVDVKRNDIYAWISDVTIAFKHVESGAKVEEFFELKDDSGADNFNVKDVMIGNNEITSFTSTRSEQIIRLDSGSKDVVTKLNAYKSINPYVLYKSEPFVQDIKNGVNVTNIKLNTLNGRRISSFVLDNDNRFNNGKLYAMITQYDVNGNKVGGPNRLDTNNAIYSYWSNADATHKSVSKIKVEVMSRNGKVLKTYYQPLTIHASTSITCQYTVNLDGIYETVKGINLIIQEWKEVNCTDC